MRLYILERLDCRGSKYDTVNSIIVRAKNSKQARKLANTVAGDEGLIWENTKRTSCEILKSEGKIGVVLRDFNAG